MAEIVSIGTAVPAFRHRQKDVIEFMSAIYGLNETEKRKLSFLYNHSGIEYRHSVIDDYSLPVNDWDFIPVNGKICFPSLEKRMEIFEREALKLSVAAIATCLEGIVNSKAITHLITVSCTGMSAPGLDLQIIEALGLASTIFRTSVNFMGCYAAIHALKLAKMICDTNEKANVLIADTELCTLHFQHEYTTDNAASSLLFADGSAAVLVSNDYSSARSISLDGFFSQVAFRGKKDMSWELSSKGFIMTLSGYVPQLVQEDISALVESSLSHHNLTKDDISYWCIHPGGKKILEAVERKLELQPDDLCYSKTILKDYGNMSSPTILFVLKEMMNDIKPSENIFGVAFGPGLTMETFLASGK